MAQPLILRSREVTGRPVAPCLSRSRSRSRSRARFKFRGAGHAREIEPQGP